MNLNRRFCKLWAPSSTLLLGLVLLYSCAHQPPDLNAFDAIIDESLLINGMDRPIAAVFEWEAAVDSRVYALRYPLSSPDSGAADRGESYFVCTVQVGPAGTFLSSERVEERRQALQATYPNRGKEFFENEFPAVGKRAMRRTGPIGPGGSSFGLIFTTNDERFDIQVTVSNQASEAVELPEFDLIGTAKRISERYDRMFLNR
jgi:hypothetical protein